MANAKMVRNNKPSPAPSSGHYAQPSNAERHHHCQQQQDERGAGTGHAPYPTDAIVSQALEIARDSEDGASDPRILAILDSGLWFIFQAVTADADYMMTPTQFSLWNYMRNRFIGTESENLWRRATAEYWNRAKGD